MAYSKALVVVGKKKVPIDVLFSSGTTVSHISESKVVELGLSTTKDDIPTRVGSLVSGDKITTTHTALVTLWMKNFKDTVKLKILPGNSSVIVLGSDWFASRQPEVQFSNKTSMMVKDKYGVRHAIAEGTSFLPAPEGGKASIARAAKPSKKS